MFKRFGFSVAIALLTLQPLAVLAQPDAATLLFMQRLASAASGPSTVEVTQGSLPSGWTAPIPLPADIQLLGSTRNAAGHSVTLYYNPTDAQAAYDAYTKQLLAAGFTAPFQQASMGGFTSSGNSHYASLCHGAQSVNVTVPGSPNDLRITIQEPNALYSFCGRRPFGIAAAVRMTSPLPAFTAPAATTVAGGQTSGGSGGLNASGQVLTTVSSSATLTGRVTASAITQSLVAQLRSSGWRITDTIAGRDTGAAAFQIDRGALRWRGSLAVFRTPRPNEYMARVDVAGTVPSVPQAQAASFQPLPQISVRTNRAKGPALLELIRRLATRDSEGAENVQIYVGQNPPGLDAAYLPAVKPVGSIAATRAGGQSSYSAFYNLSNAQLQAYFARLHSDGWNAIALPQGGMGGFQNVSLAGMATFCKVGKALIVAQVTPNSNAVAISAQQLPSGTPNICSAMEQFPFPAGLSRKSPLPQLTAPAGATMHPGTPGIMGAGSASGAGFVTTMPLAQLLDALTLQLTNAGWKAAPSSVTDTLGSRSFSIVDEAGQHWQAVMTIYRSDLHPDRYYSFIDLTNLSADTTGF